MSTPSEQPRQLDESPTASLDPILAEIIRCPCKSRARLVPDEESSALVCDPSASTACAYGRFGFVGNNPVLIDFDNSIVDEGVFWDRAGASYYASSSRPGKALRLPDRLRKRLRGVNEVTESLAPKLFIENLQKAADEPVVLVVGGGAHGRGLSLIEAQPNSKVLVFDIYQSLHTDFVADGHSIPIADQSVDGVWIQAVLEHVLTPEQVVAEIRRVLRPGGIVFADSPFMYPVHEGAYDFLRFSESGHRWLFRHFERIDSGASSGPGRAALVSLNYAFKALFRNRKVANLATLSFFWLRFIDKVCKPGAKIDAAASVYFLGRKSETVLNPSDMPGYYRGEQ